MIDTETSSMFAAMRQAMIVSQLRPNGVTDLRVLKAMQRIPRENYVPADRRASAYIDRSIPLGGGRSLNAPLATALLLNAAEINTGHRVLIVGAATGYVVAITLTMTPDVVAVEPDERLVATLRSQIPGDINLVTGPMDAGAPALAPFDAIVIDGAVEAVPSALIGQLKPDGRLVCAIDEAGVTRLSVGRRGGTGFALARFIDLEAVALPGFSCAREFVF